MTKELSNNIDFPPIYFPLTGSELIPGKQGNNGRVAITTTNISDFTLGTYSLGLEAYTQPITPDTKLMMVGPEKAYTLSTSSLTAYLNSHITLTSTGLVGIMAGFDGTPNIDVPIASVAETDAAIISTKAVVPSDLANYKSRLDTLEAEVAQLLYVPTHITSFTATPSLVEIGTVVTSVSLVWTINKNVTSQTMTNFSGTVPFGTRALIITGSFSTNQTWTLTATDGQTISTASASLLFENQRYWGVSTNASIANSDILGFSSEFATSAAKSTIYNATGGNYVYYCYPASFGLLSNVKVGGLAFSDFTTTAINFTNASGHTSSYNVLRINNIQTGANIQVDWA